MSRRSWVWATKGRISISSVRMTGGGKDLRCQGRAANKAEILELRSAQVRCQHGIQWAAMAGQDRAMHLFGQRGPFFPLPSWNGRGAVGGKAFPAQHDQHQQQRQQA